MTMKFSLIDFYNKIMNKELQNAMFRMYYIPTKLIFKIGINTKLRNTFV